MVSLPLILLITTALFSGAMVLSIIIAIQSGREHRNSIFPIVRESEGIKAKQARISTVLFLVLTGLTIGGWVATQQNPNNVLKATQVAEQTIVEHTSSVANDNAQAESNLDDTKTNNNTPLTESESSAASGDFDNTTNESVINNPANLPETPTTAPKIVGSTVVVTVEPTATSIVVENTDLQETQQTQQPENAVPATNISSPAANANPSPVPISSQTSMGPITLATAIDDNRKAVGITEVFDAGTPKVYAIFPYSEMETGAPFAAVWYYQGQELFRDEYEWSWGRNSQSYVFIKPLGPGEYKIELQISNNVMASKTFEVK